MTNRWTHLAMVLGVGLVVAGATKIWSRHDFCRGWADHYAAEAERLRAEAAAPGLGVEEARERRMAAELRDVVARKYAATASAPWRPYPGYPLVTPEEQRLAAARH